ncbi:MAG: hypothetical protein U0271_22905 [Polyangiaceae bacterium]
MCAVSAIDPARLPASLKRLSSQRSIPWPLDIEVGASPEEIAVGARVSAIVGLTARGLIRLGFAQRWGWWRDGTEVVAEPLTEVHEIEAIVSSVDREAWTHEPPLERALVEVLAELGERFDYRVVERSWVRLSTVLERAWAPIGLGGLVPVWSMDLGSGEEEIALENLELEIPGLVSGLARVVVEREVA